MIRETIKNNVYPTIAELLNNKAIRMTSHLIPIKNKNGLKYIYVREFSPLNPTKTILMGHAMFCQGNYLCRKNVPSLTSCLLEKNCQVFVPDLRAHGESCDYASWNIDDLIQDIGQTLSFIQTLSPLPLFLVGHSLSGILYLVQQSLTANKGVKGIVTIGAAPWNRSLISELKRSYYLKIRLITFFIKVVTKVYGCMPARKFKLGSADECKEVLNQLVFDNFYKNQFLSTSGQINYMEWLKNITTPLLCLTSKNDLFACQQHVENFVETIQNKEFITVEKSSHMALAASSDNWEVWNEVFMWVDKQ